MKKVILLLAITCQPLVYADSFNKEFAAFDQDFARLNQMVLVKKNRPVTTAVPPAYSHRPEVTAVEPNEVIRPPLQTPDDYTDDSTTTPSAVATEVDPLSPDRLGYSVDDPKIRDKLSSLYKTPGIKVFSYTLQAE